MRSLLKAYSPVDFPGWAEFGQFLQLNNTAYLHCKDGAVFVSDGMCMRASDVSSQWTIEKLEKCWNQPIPVAPGLGVTLTLDQYGSSSENVIKANKVKPLVASNSKPITFLQALQADWFIMADRDRKKRFRRRKIKKNLVFTEQGPELCAILAELRSAKDKGHQVCYSPRYDGLVMLPVVGLANSQVEQLKQLYEPAIIIQTDHNTYSVGLLCPSLLTKSLTYSAARKTARELSMQFGGDPLVVTNQYLPLPGFSTAETGFIVQGISGQRKVCQRASEKMRQIADEIQTSARLWESGALYQALVRLPDTIPPKFWRAALYKEHLEDLTQNCILPALSFDQVDLRVACRLETCKVPEAEILETIAHAAALVRGERHTEKLLKYANAIYDKVCQDPYSPSPEVVEAWNQITRLGKEKSEAIRPIQAQDQSNSLSK